MDFFGFNKGRQIITKRRILGKKPFDYTQLNLQAEETSAKHISEKLFDCGSQCVKNTKPRWKPWNESFFKHIDNKKSNSDGRLPVHVTIKCSLCILRWPVFVLLSYFPSFAKFIKKHK